MSTDTTTGQRPASHYDGDTRVLATASGWSVTFRGDVYYIRLKPDIDGYEAVSADGANRFEFNNFLDSPDRALAFFLGEPQ